MHYPVVQVYGVVCSLQYETYIYYLASYQVKEIKTATSEFFKISA